LFDIKGGFGESKVGGMHFDGKSSGSQVIFDI
jgi:hypothetical protein